MNVQSVKYDKLVYSPTPDASNRPPDLMARIAPPIHDR